jgi:hypothetical protein
MRELLRGKSEAERSTDGVQRDPEEAEMTTKLESIRLPDGTYQHRDISRELPQVKLNDSGRRRIVATISSDGWLSLRAKGLKREVKWKLDALYEQGVKEGRVL